MVECSTWPPRSSRSAATWRVLRGYAPSQRTPISRTAGGKCAPLKLIAMARSLMVSRGSWREIIAQMASKENVRQNLYESTGIDEPLLWDKDRVENARRFSPMCQAFTLLQTAIN